MLSSSFSEVPPVLWDAPSLKSHRKELAKPAKKGRSAKVFGGKAGPTRAPLPG